jgi:hypothetical protein
VEHQPKSNEHLRHEHSAELQKLAHEQGAERHEHKAETAHEQAERVHEAREAIKHVEAPHEQHEAGAKEATPTFVSGLSRRVNYEQTMVTLRHHLSPMSRRFSKVIHSPAVEQISDAAGATVFRPSVINGGLLSAVVIGGALYLTARYYGFEFPGSALFMLLILGGITGALVEILARNLRRIRG